MARLTLDLVEGGDVSFKAEGGFIKMQSVTPFSEVLAPEGPTPEGKVAMVQKEIGSIRREDCVHLQSFIKDSMPSMAKPTDEWFNQWVLPIFEQIMRAYLEKTRIEEPPPSEETK